MEVFMGLLIAFLVGRGTGEDAGKVELIKEGAICKQDTAKVVDESVTLKKCWEVKEKSKEIRNEKR